MDPTRLPSICSLMLEEPRCHRYRAVVGKATQLDPRSFNILDKKNPVTKRLTKVKRRLKELKFKLQFVIFEELPSPSKPTAGLYNLGNTCYSNAVLQCLANTAPILEICCGEIHTPERQFLKKFGMLLEDMWKQDRPLKPKEFHKYVGSLESRFGNYTEEDSMEYLQFLICQLRNELNSPTEYKAITETTDKSLQSWQEYVQIENSPLVHIFASQIFKAIRCQSCPYTSESYEVYWEFSFPIPEKPNATIQDCFAQLFEGEVIEDYTCEKCKQKGCVKTFNVSKWPKILIIQFFRFSAFQQQKIDKMIYFPFTLDLPQFGSTTKYDLYAVVNHFGNRDSGHYLADAKHPISGKWYRYDNNKVKGIESNKVVTTNAFILFYKELE
ncbi:USP2 [Cordylochernes scorpioides]|uniref:ubiquitinyl hydrolase 1 n=1 Tax=Cordylochernes scorpioides TaxID=51811 RepID=A0ABY6KY41_9ARAC|nr:USP2 [Cordylochernes scorpioides]